jgi:hypothetical protein
MLTNSEIYGLRKYAVDIGDYTESKFRMDDE